MSAVPTVNDSPRPDDARVKAAAGPVVVLGVGNPLMGDDGIGVQAVRVLAESYRIPDDVRLIDAGLSGFAWLPELAAARGVLIVDAVRNNAEPGTIYRFSPDELQGRNGPLLSAHDVGLVEIVQMAELLGPLPPTVILGIEPRNMGTFGQGLSAELQRALPTVVEAIAAELHGFGVAIDGGGTRKQSPTT